MRTITTYMDTRGGEIHICTECETARDKARNWPRNPFGEEYASVSYGRHRGRCDYCEDDDVGGVAP